MTLGLPSSSDISLGAPSEITAEARANVFSQWTNAVISHSRSILETADIGAKQVCPKNRDLSLVEFAEVVSVATSGGGSAPDERTWESRLEFIHWDSVKDGIGRYVKAPDINYISHTHPDMKNSFQGVL